MQVVFLAKFSKDLDKIKSKKLKTSILEIIENFEKTSEIKEITSLKKMKGHRTAYRIRLGDYRLGLYAENKKIILARFVH